MIAAIETALGQRLATMPGAPPIVWPNKAADPARPYVVFDHVPVDAEDRTIAGGATEQLGYVVITVVAPIDRFATEAATLADQIAARFSFALRLTAGSGQVVITKPPAVLRPFRDGDDWRQPVRVDYRAA